MISGKYCAEEEAEVDEAVEVGRGEGVDDPRREGPDLARPEMPREEAHRQRTEHEGEQDGQVVDGDGVRGEEAQRQRDDRRAEHQLVEEEGAREGIEDARRIEVPRIVQELVLPPGQPPDLIERVAQLAEVVAEPGDERPGEDDGEHAIDEGRP